MKSSFSLQVTTGMFSYDESEKGITSNRICSLGLYGWMSSPEEDMTANIGLHDSLAAVQWTKEYISKFGGDSDRITVIGQSAGAGIINLMLTSYGGKGDLPFSQVHSDTFVMCVFYIY